MNRARPFRLTMWRLGCLILAWYALVLQSVLLATTASAHDANSLASITLCLDGGTAHGLPDGPAGEPPLHSSHQGGACACIVHGMGGSPLAPPAMAASLSGLVLAGSEPLTADDILILPVACRGHAAARGPPMTLRVFV